MEKDGSTHRDHPVAHTQRAVFVCRSALCDSRDVDSLKQNKTRTTTDLKHFCTFVDNLSFTQTFSYTATNNGIIPNDGYNKPQTYM